MAVWNEKFYKGNDVYSDGSIEDEIFDIVCREDYEENKQDLIGSNYAVAYHLSPIRENILNWYPFTKEQSVIEIGAGCGAITGVLCRKLGRVVSVDLSKRRSKINYERHKKYENLEIVVGNFNDMEFQEQYDYVVLNGVFEYAISFTESDQPYHNFLRHISRFLKPNGKFLISIENKLGLKYFNGAKEDHTGNYFLGLNNYSGNETVRTFSKTELEEILEEVGFGYTKFYYPYPDYKFPNEVFTDKSMKINQYGRPFVNIDDDRYFLFNENTVGKSLLKENIRDIFANSFLVEAGREIFESEIVYAKLNVERKPEFQIGTSIIEKKGKRCVIKYPIHPTAKNHIDNIYQTCKSAGKKVQYLPSSKTNNGIEFEYLYTNNLDAYIVELINEGNIAKIVNTIRGFFDSYLKEFSIIEKKDDFYNHMFSLFFGAEKTSKNFLCVKKANIDLIMDNIYEINGKYILIDGEWIYPEWIPYDFIKWRSLNELYTKHSDLSSLISRKEMLELNEISAEDEKLFLSWAIHFAEIYVGSFQRTHFAKSVQTISLDDIHRDLRSQKVATMSLYMDFGEGFTEEGKLYKDVEIVNGRFQVTFSSDLLSKAKKLRFDPVEGQVCTLRIEEISKGFKILGDNSSETTEDGQLYVNQDPQVYIDVETGLSSITLKADFKIIQKEDLIKCLQEINDKRLMLNAHVENVENRVKEIFDELGQTSNKLQETVATLSKKNNELEVCKDTIVLQHELRGEISQKDEIIVRLIHEKDEMIAQKNFLEAEKEMYKNYANSTKEFIKRKLRIKWEILKNRKDC